MANSTMVKLLAASCGSPAYITCHIATWIWKLVPLTLLVIGTCGNLISLAVLFRKKLRKHSTSVYIIFIALSDMCFLYSSVLNTSFQKIFRIRLEIRSEFNCAIAEFMIYFSATGSLYLLLLLTIERMIFTLFPFFARSKLTRNNAVVASLCTLICMLLLNGHLLFGRKLQTLTSDEENATETKTCFPTDEAYAKFYLTQWGFIVLTVNYILPLILVVFGNIILVAALYRQRRKIKPNAISQSKPGVSMSAVMSNGQIKRDQVAGQQVTLLHVQKKAAVSEPTEEQRVNLNMDTSITMDMSRSCQEDHSPATVKSVTHSAADSANPVLSQDESKLHLSSGLMPNPQPYRSHKDSWTEKRKSSLCAEPVTGMSSNARLDASTSQMNTMENGQASASKASHPTKNKSVRLKSATKLLFIMSTFSVITITPFCGYNIYMRQVKPEDLNGANLAVNQLIFSIIYCLILSNVALNFFWYLMTGSIFKTELRSMLRDLRAICSSILDRIKR